MTEQKVLDFWFKEVGPAKWFAVSEETDTSIRSRFQKTHAAARRGELASWRSNAGGALAEVLVLDQFSRNMYRNQPEAFASDEMALERAQEAVVKSFDLDLDPREKSFLYMPYMHSESLVVHEEAVRLFSQPGLENNLKFELKHKAIIKKFGRYPHRNKILGRTSTSEELAFLEAPGSSF